MMTSYEYREVNIPGVAYVTDEYFATISCFPKSMGDRRRRCVTTYWYNERCPVWYTIDSQKTIGDGRIE